VEHRTERRASVREAVGIAKRMRATSARPVGSFVPKLTRKVFQKYGFSAATLLTDWPAIVGEDLAGYTQPERLKWPRAVDTRAEPQEGVSGRPGATLQLRVEGARALDVQYRSRQIIERINAHFGYRAVAELRFIQAPVDGLRRPQPCAESVAHGAPSRPLPEVAGMQDERLKSALQRLYAGVAREAAGR
jgi:hypothetical protein